MPTSTAKDFLPTCAPFCFFPARLPTDIVRCLRVRNRLGAEHLPARFGGQECWSGIWPSTRSPPPHRTLGPRPSPFRFSVRPAQEIPARMVRGSNFRSERSGSFRWFWRPPVRKKPLKNNQRQNHRPKKPTGRQAELPSPGPQAPLRRSPLHGHNPCTSTTSAVDRPASRRSSVCGRPTCRRQLDGPLPIATVAVVFSLDPWGGPLPIWFFVSFGRHPIRAHTTARVARGARRPD